MTSAPPNPNKYQIMPDMTPDEFEALKADIKHKGVVVPIEYDTDGNILDGHHRFRAFAELIEEGADLPMFDKVERRFSSEEAKLDYVISLNVKRRHLSGKQRQELIVKLRQPPYNYSQNRIATVLHVSNATVSRDIDALPADVKEHLNNQDIVATDGRVYDPAYVTRVISTGTQTLKQMQQKAAQTIAQNLKTSGFVVTEPADVMFESETPPPANTNFVAEPTPKPVINDDDARKRITAFAWYGGKGSHLSWLLPLLPPAKHFIDLYGGSAAVLLNRAPSPIETYNDLDSGVVNFFKVLRERADVLADLLYMTPYSREERRIAYNIYEHIEKYNHLSDIERARLFFVLARQTRSGIVQQSNAMLNSWRFTRDKVSNGMASQNAAWANAIDGLSAVASRLRNVQIENYPAHRILDLYDSPDTLVYADPPYVHSTRADDKHKVYKFEMSDADHTALAARLHTFKGLVAISGYRSELYDTLYRDWDRFDMPAEASAGSAGNSDISRVECLWTNYPLVRS